MLPTVSIRSGKTLLLDGPASVRLLSGQGAYLGATLTTGHSFTVRAGRRFPVEASSDSNLELKLGTAASYRELDRSTVPGSWKEASTIVQQTRGTIVILGNVDSGKSTLSTLLANESISANLTVGIVDGDIGQADLGPPTTISGASVKNPIYDLQNVTTDASFFVGDTSPENVQGRVWAGLKAIRSRLSSADVVLVNTDGWLEGDNALNYKQGIFDRLQPNLVLAIDDEGDQHQALNRLIDSQKRTVIRLATSEFARQRTRDERKRAREMGYMRFLKGSNHQELRLNRVSIRRFDSQQSLLELPSRDRLKGVLSGLLDQDGMLIGVCRILDADAYRIRIETGVRELESVRTLELGSVVLSENYEEVGFVPYT